MKSTANELVDDADPVEQNERVARLQPVKSLDADGETRGEYELEIVLRLILGRKMPMPIGCVRMTS